MVEHTEHTGHQTGKLTSWIAVAIMVLGFVIFGLALVLGPIWPMFWIGLAVLAGGGIYGLAVGIMEDYG
jgi:hypothetical protein